MLRGIFGVLYKEMEGKIIILEIGNTKKGGKLNSWKIKKEEKNHSAHRKFGNCLQTEERKKKWYNSQENTSVLSTKRDKKIIEFTKKNAIITENASNS